MPTKYYRIGCYLSAFIKQQCIRETVLHRDRLNLPGPFLLACTHLSHIEPMIMSPMVKRPIHWMARIEFYRNRFLGPLLRNTGTFCVNRQGVPVQAIRTAIGLAKAGKIVGIFPEGGCRKGKQLAFRGGKIKGGTSAISLQAQVPIIPVAIVGTDRMTDVERWLPGKYGQVWVAIGEPIYPPPRPTRTQRRAARHALTEQLEQTYVALYQEILETTGLTDDYTP
ncbi:MAG TPA: lysophospholipid acyltransferase family protein [Tepidisphaeraceae bacterium]|jgi:1-acyl-sn-glycerol-3-phosphate acyltransferase|nr:lysophospholipid acyltransferase family protein [Tepidisphaeraceae bacterium]